jgi:hypothetical protein
MSMPLTLNHRHFDWEEKAELLVELRDARNDGLAILLVLQGMR